MLAIRDLRAVLLASPVYVVLAWTNPSVNAMTRIGCADSAIPLSDLASVRLYYQARWSWPAPPVMLREKDERGREGLRDTLAIPSVAGYGTGWMVMRDRAGNEGAVLLGGRCGKRWFAVGAP